MSFSLYLQPRKLDAKMHHPERSLQKSGLFLYQATSWRLANFTDES